MRVKKPEFNDSFSVEDIHKLREYNYEETKDLTKEELINGINEKANIVREKIAEKRKQKLTA